MSVTTSNYHFGSTGWCDRTTSMMLMTGTTEGQNPSTSPNVDDGLTSLSWLQNLNMCRLGAPTPPTPPASPVCSSNCSINALTANTNKLMNNKSIISSKVDAIHNTNLNKIQSLFQSHKEGRNHSNGSSNSSKKSSQTNENESIDYKTNGSVKPPFSYATLICMAMKANKNKMTLSAIYKWIRENFLYYKNADPSWQNSIRHNLSLNKCFIKIPRNKDEPGKGGFWRLDPVYADTLVDGIFKKRRPSQRGSGASNGAPFRKKSRRKENMRNDCSQTPALNNTKGLTTNGTDTHLIHDTPPNSTESYALYGEAANDVVELVTAVNSIEGVGAVGQCGSYSYTIQGIKSEPQLIQSGYGNEVCITESVPEDCILETEDGEICWNAILTDADLNELTNFASPVIQATDASITISDSTTTTAQLTAVEPHSLHLVANATPTNCVIEESDAFHNGMHRNVNCLAIRPNMGSDVIAATHNVVTCVNPTIANTSEWNQWHTFSTVANPECQSTDLIVRQVNANCEPMVSTSASIVYTTASVNTSCSRPNPSLKQPNGVNNHNINSSSGASTQPSSPAATNFEHNNPLQPWAECKAALEAAALDLESFATLDVVQHY